MSVGCDLEKQQDSNSSTITKESAPQELETSDNKYITVADPDNAIAVQFPKEWNENEKEHPYDIQYFSKNESMNTGIFIYRRSDLASDITAKDILEFQIGDLRSKRENFIEIDPIETIEMETKTIMMAAYSGDKNTSKNNYKFTVVEFAENSDVIVALLQVSVPSDWQKNKPVLEAIAKSLQPISATAEE